jgi:hypothetical protein
MMQFQYLIPGVLLFVAWGVMWSNAGKIIKHVPRPLAIIAHLLLGLSAAHLLILGSGA